MLDLPLCAHVCSLDSLGTSPPASARLTERGAGKALKKGHRQIPCPARRILYAITADETPAAHIARTNSPRWLPIGPTAIIRFPSLLVVFFRKTLQQCF
ncbi:hypothetical protein ALO62_102037 [Pseudomonas amygdali pv. myricae]|uniref:Uncharacterized protein n=1 Tax=Pseudomonas syringae pv. actinidiae TaxID=103796 RepID=A0A7Z6UET5_PSESF|nr:hypothetical protein ALO62_102037 [Pseudomonas amygdali pv. myricae]KPY49343.1 hypothetical protein ALO48_101606 [Pseudomonas syringae pv. rhaphiolepidis]KPY60771.1 hypothetical protein ALO93_101716 [Pseudomonas amygdali pv. sesami]RMP81634.1 hypothetical protein ALQ15_109453 [Pseudomonas syringae pv. actinidiae]RMR54251.1 hypothetical protein ALP83_101123 [Pseudomonas syringae pv. actinidiae]